MKAIETAYLRVPADPASLRDFIARAEADAARPDGGLVARWPEFAADVARAARLARAWLAREGD